MLVACGGSVAPGGGAANDAAPQSSRDGGAAPEDAAPPADDADTDAGIPYPAPHPPAPQVISFGGSTLSAPVVVPVFYPGDPMQSKIEQMLAQVAQSAYWTAVGQEYKVGPLKVASSIVLGDTPPHQIDDTQIASWLADHVDGAHSPWPKADGSQIFTVFYPTGTTITMQNGSSCRSFGGYHDEGSASGLPFPYAVIPRCGGGGTLSALDEVTVAVSHELIEAATDPYVQTTPAYAGVDFDHYTWSWFPGGEVGDMCAFERQADAPLVGSFVVQRSWSNAAAKASHDPCVPALMQPYFNSAPELKDVLKLGFGGGSVSTKGAKIALGQSKTLNVDLFSDAPTGPWTVDAIDAASLQGQPAELTFSWDRTSGQNGDVLHLTITAAKASQYGVSLFTIRSTQGTVEHLWYGAVGQQ